MRILFTSPIGIKNETRLIHKLMTFGNWDVLHLRKPDWSKEKTLQLFHALPEKIREKTVLHESGKISCHSFEEVKKLEGKVDYCFLSPIYDSISKEGYKAKFEKKELKKFLQQKRKTKIIALGGMTEENYKKALDLGFDGGAFLGAVWNQSSNNTF